MFIFRLFRICSFLLFIPAFVSAQSDIREGNDYAIFFYCTNFKNPGWPDLPETRKEAKAIAQELRDNYGFQTALVPNPTREEIRNQIAEWNERVRPEDQVLYFFSTHGYYDQAGNEGFLVPVNGKVQDPYGDTWLSYAELGRRVTKSKSEHLLLALDACYSGAFGIRYKGVPTQKPWEESADCTEKVQYALAHPGRLYFTSGSKDQRTPASSLFARRWLATLRKGAELGVIDSEDLRYYLGQIEALEPEGGVFTGHEDGDFVFVHQDACSPRQNRDQEHWQRIYPDPSRSEIVAHLEDYPGCPHYQKALQLLAKPGPVTSEQTTTSDPASRNPDLSDMVFVKGGAFQMGSTEGHSDETPVRRVTVSDFYMGRHEVTVEEFAEFLNDMDVKVAGEKVSLNGNLIYDLICSGCDQWEDRIQYSGGIFTVVSGFEKHPATLVTWYGAIAYCNWRSKEDRLSPVYSINGADISADWNADGYRLPTEAEWEFAARSRGKDATWAGTSSEEQLVNYANGAGDQDGYANTAPVGSFRENDLGLFDMSGNVWEWCWDWYDSDYYRNRPSANPKGPDEGSNRVRRGGSWRDVPSNLRCANRSNRSPGYRGRNLGFRLSRAAR